MTRKSYEIVGRDGRIVDDDHPVLRDGETLRVPLHMRDHETLSPQQREVMAGKAARRADDAARRFGLDDGLALHRPGQRFAVDAAARERVEQARAEGIRDMCDAWKTPPPESNTGVGELRGAKEGDACTVREGGVGEGGPGHLRVVNGKLTCVPDQRSQDGASVPRTMDAADAQKIKDAAWREMVDELEGAWRKP
jgi:hypothetical protein